MKIITEPNARQIVETLVFSYDKDDFEITNKQTPELTRKSFCLDDIVSMGENCILDDKTNEYIDGCEITLKNGDVFISNVSYERGMAIWLKHVHFMK